MSYYEDLIAFHEKYGHSIGAKPQWLDEDEFALRMRLIGEEGLELENELLDVLDEGESPIRMANIAKETADVIYVLIGTMVSMGIDFDKVWNEVHESNMSKQVGLKDEGGKQLKGASFKKADILGVLGLEN